MSENTVLGMVGGGEIKSISKDVAMKLGRDYFAKRGGVINNSYLKQLFKDYFDRGSYKAIKSAERAIKSYEVKLGQHLNKLENILNSNGYVSSVQKEITNFSNNIKTLKEFIDKIK